MRIAGRRVLVVGAALSGVAAARFLRAHGAHVTLSDRRPAEELPEARQLARELGVKLETGGHTTRTFLEQDLVVVSPGVPTKLPELGEARATGMPVIGEMELASRFLQGRIVAITGSNGKTTTTALLGNILETAGFAVQVSGNIGRPLSSLVETSRPESIHAIEVSSFQLETIDQFRPSLAVVLNVTPDHLDRHCSFESYAEAKARIFLNQTEQDFAVLNADDAVCQRFAARTRARVRWFSRSRTVEAGAFVEGGDVVVNGVGVVSPLGRPAHPENETAGKDRLPALPYTLFGMKEIPLKGAHNVENVLAAVCAATLLGADPRLIRAGVRSFRAVEHRLEYVATINGVEFYNDSKATNVDATLKALGAFPGGLLVILGGQDKGSDYTPLRPLLAQKARCALLIGAAADKIAVQLGEAVPVVRAGNLEAAVPEAARRAQPHDVVLLAPACASFDQFENYEHRGRVFKELVKELAGDHAPGTRRP